MAGIMSASTAGCGTSARTRRAAGAAGPSRTSIRPWTTPGSGGLRIARARSRAVAVGWTGPAEAQGVLRVGIASNLNTLDPPKMKIGEEYVFNVLVFGGLVVAGVILWDVFSPEFTN